jgi:mRNA interferase RelE/StbE
MMPKDMVTIPREEFERLVEAAEDLEDLRAIEAYEANPKEGIPDEYVGRILDGEPLLRVFREWRGLNQSELARASGVHRVSIADIEAGRKTGSVKTLKKLADALRITIDDLV